MRTVSHATYVMYRVRIFCSRGRLCQGTFTLMSGDWYKMVLCPHSGYTNCLSSTLLRQQTPFLQKERDCVGSTGSEPTENACSQGPGAHLSTNDQRV